MVSVSTFSDSESEFLSLSSCSETTNMEAGGDNLDRSSVTEVSGVYPGTGKLVLVDVGGSNLSIKQEPFEGGIGDTTSGDLKTWLNDIVQRLQGLFEHNNKVIQLEKIETMESLLKTVLSQMETLSEQVRDMQLLQLKGSLLPSITTSPESFGHIKVENLFKPHDQVFQTPKKSMEQPMRLDVTPVSGCSDIDQQNGVSSTAIENSRRSLEFPKTLEAMLDDNKGNVNKSRAMDNGRTPTLSLVDALKVGNHESPYHGESKLGSLLVLADAALTRSPEQSAYIYKNRKDAVSEFDSGRSSGESCRSSPTLSQDGIKIKSAQKFARYAVYNNNGVNATVSSKSGFSSSASASPDAKMRKRRKVKQPLPCNFCGKCFNNQSSLRQHESFHRPVRPFKCENEKCDKAYKTRSELNRHLVVHSGEKKHECKLCGKRFLRKQYLKTHLLRHHETGLAMVAPSAIDSFKDNSSGSIPSIVVSSSLVSKTEPLTWRCQMCFKIFVNADDLARHVRSYHEKKKVVGVNLDQLEENRRMDEN